jgi:hypothetical protein
LQKELQRHPKGKPPEKKELTDRYEAADKLFDIKPEKKGQSNEELQFDAANFVDDYMKRKQERSKNTKPDDENP